MAATGARRTQYVDGGEREHGRSLAQWFCLNVGPTLILVGILGFLAESKFDTAAGGDPGALDGHDFLIFEVNGWHNVVHIVSGLFLLVFARRHAAAKTAALAFAAIYAVVSVVGLIDGKDVFGLFPIDKADNVLHIVLAVAALAAGLVSTREREQRDERRAVPARARTEATSTRA